MFDYLCLREIDGEIHATNGMSNTICFRDNNTLYVGILYHVDYEDHQDKYTYMAMIELDMKKPLHKKRKIYNKSYSQLLESIRDKPIPLDLGTMSIYNFIYDDSFKVVNRCCKYLTRFEYDVLQAETDTGPYVLAEIPISMVLRLINISDVMNCIINPVCLIDNKSFMLGTKQFSAKYKKAAIPTPSSSRLGPRINIEINRRILNVLLYSTKCCENILRYDTHKDKAIMRVMYNCLHIEEMHGEPKKYLSNYTELYMNSISIGKLNKFTLKYRLDKKKICGALVDIIKSVDHIQTQ